MAVNTVSQSIPPAKDNLELAIQRRRFAFIRAVGTALSPFYQENPTEKIDSALDELFAADFEVREIRKFEQNIKERCFSDGTLTPQFALSRMLAGEILEARYLKGGPGLRWHNHRVLNVEKEKQLEYEHSSGNWIQGRIEEIFDYEWRVPV
jgi:hypothetical protein